MKITDVKILDNKIMILRFSSGEERLFDATELKGSAFEPLSDNRIFRDVSIDHGVVTWMDGEIDCSPEFMYEHSGEYRPDMLVSSVQA